MEGGGCPERRLAVLAEVAYRAMAAMVDLVLVRLEPCFSCLSSDPCGSPKPVDGSAVLNLTSRSGDEKRSCQTNYFRYAMTFAQPFNTKNVAPAS